MSLTVNFAFMNPSQSALTKEEVGTLVSIIMVMQRRFMANLMGKLNKGSVSFPQFFLLGHLCSHGPTGMRRIAELMGHSTPAATGLVKRLEKLGYIKRAHEEVDRRKVTVHATPKAARLVEGIREEFVGNLEKLLEKLDPQEQHSWLDIYKKLRDYCTTCNP
jgi:DNA-binding MarR family transcriptional regulator